MNIQEENLFCDSLASQFWVMAGIWRLINSYAKQLFTVIALPWVCGSKQ